MSKTIILIRQHPKGLWNIYVTTPNILRSKGQPIQYRTRLTSPAAAVQKALSAATDLERLFNQPAVFFTPPGADWSRLEPKYNPETGL